MCGHSRSVCWAAHADGCVFVGLIAFHVANNRNHLSQYVRGKALWLTLAITADLTGLFLWQPGPVQSILALSRNPGPATDRFEMKDDGLVYHDSPAESCKMAQSIRAGKTFDSKTPPHAATWLENVSFYHIKTLHRPVDREAGRAALPYRDFKVLSWEEAKRNAAGSWKDLREQQEVDGVCVATHNSSFDPAADIVPADPNNPMPYCLLIEIDQRDDDQTSLVYSVEVDNANPQAIQPPELVGSPTCEENDENGNEVWALYFADERIDSALGLIENA